MAGTINSLGIGSGILTSDLVDKLRTSDESKLLKPLERKIELGVQKEDAYTLLSTLMTTFQSSTTALDGDNLYLSRAVSGNTDAVTVTAETGSNVQNFTIENINKAEADVWNSTSQASKSTALDSLGSGTFSITSGANTYDITYQNGDSLNDIKDAINDVASADMTASVLQVADGSYQLIMTAKDTNEPITFADTNDGTDDTADSLTDILSLGNIQVAKPSTFDYNGIAITRDTNEITDLIVGVSITLNGNQAATDSASIKIEQNSTSISSEMSLFVNGYNSLMTNLSDMTNSNRETGAVGIFNSESFVKSIGREITKLITSVDANGNSLINYGIEIDRDGLMTLDNDVFAKKFVADPKGMELFFSGDSTTDGIFTKLDTKMTEYTGYNKLLSDFSNQLSSNQTNATQQYDKQKASLDSRYQILTQKFIAYDAIISRANAEFSSMKSMIDAQYASNN